MTDLLAPGLFYAILKDAWHLFRGRRRRLSPSEILQLRQKWKTPFEEEVFKTVADNLSKDVIIHDVKRLDIYPNADKKSIRISPWYRVGLLGVYHKGILVGLRWGGLVKHDGSNHWRYTDYNRRESSDLEAILIGRIPFEMIESVDWDGDEYHYIPHIFCHFDGKRKQPYESLAFCIERCNPGGLPFYVEVAPYEKVRQLSKRLGINSSF